MSTMASARKASCVAAFTLTVLGLQAASCAAKDKVSVSFYAEALCPYCALATTSVVAPIFENGLANFTDFRYIPSGNAKNGSQGLECQHGPAECRLNRVIACAIDQASVQEAWFPFLQCLEAKFGPGMEDTVEECAEAADLDFVDIEECASGAKGNELERAAKEETDALVPRHTYVPWFVVNGVPLLDGYASLQTFICVALPSDSRPDVCLAPAAAVVDKAPAAAVVDKPPPSTGPKLAGGLAWLLDAGRRLLKMV